MSCDLHEFQSDVLPCPWPGCRNGFPEGQRGAVGDHFLVPIYPRDRWFVICEPGTPVPDVTITTETFIRQGWGVGGGRSSVSRAYSWHTIGPAPPRAAPFFRDEDTPIRFLRGSSLQRWIDLAVVNHLRRYKTLDERRVEHIIADAVGPWIGGAIMVGTILVAWAAAYFSTKGGF